YPAAFAAADHGIQVALVNAEPKPGGVCLHRGCIPSKALLHVAKLIQETREAAHWGVKFAPPKIDLDQLRKWKSDVDDKLTAALELESVPARLLVIGGGYIGLEMGTVYAALDSKVVVVEMLPGLLPGADRDLVRPLQKRVEGIFESIRLNTKVESLDVKRGG